MTDIEKRLGRMVDGSKTTLVEFFADWCPHCQRMMPLVAKLRERMGADVNIVQVEGDLNRDMMEDYSVDGYPTWIIFKDGKERWRDNGEMPLGELEGIVRSFA